MSRLEQIFRNYLQQFLKLGKKEKIIIIAILVGCFFFGLAIPTAVQKIAYKPSPTPLPTPTEIPLPASLKLITDKKEIELGATFSAVLELDSPNQGVEAADFVIDFDPNYLKIATISSGNYFGVFPVKEIGTNSAQLSGMANLVNNQIVIPKGKGIVGSFIFEALEATESTKIKFDREKTIVASGGKNIVEQINDLTLQIIHPKESTLRQ